MVADARAYFVKVDIWLNHAGASRGEAFKMGPHLDLSCQGFHDHPRLNLHRFLLCGRVRSRHRARPGAPRGSRDHPPLLSTRATVEITRPLGRPGEAEDMTGLTVYLASQSVSFPGRHPSPR
jgi:hypothetical protein